MRLWRVGDNHCLQVFQHNDYGKNGTSIFHFSRNGFNEHKFLSLSLSYTLSPLSLPLSLSSLSLPLLSLSLSIFRCARNAVTCVEFNPTDESQFISGSIDGKVRIWGIAEVRVVDWLHFGDIITAVRYRPDGQVTIIPSISAIFFMLSRLNKAVNAGLCRWISLRTLPPLFI